MTESKQSRMMMWSDLPLGQKDCHSVPWRQGYPKWRCNCQLEHPTHYKTHKCTYEQERCLRIPATIKNKKETDQNTISSYGSKDSLLCVKVSMYSAVRPLCNTISLMLFIFYLSSSKAIYSTQSIF